MPVTAYSYIRYSSKPQEMGDSLRRQTERAKKYAAEHGFVLDDTLKDLGRSAHSGEHIEKGAFGTFLQDIKDGKVKRGSVLLVESMDRMSRETPFRAFGVFSDILNAGVDIVTLTDERRYSAGSLKSEPTQLFTMIAEMVRAHGESERKKDLSLKNWEKKRQNIGTKLLTAKCPAWLRAKPDRTGFEFIPEFKPIVTRIIAMYRSGAYGFHGIASVLNEENVPTMPTREKRAKHWASSAVRNIITSPALWGAFEEYELSEEKGRRVRSGRYFEDYFPAIVSREEWLSLQGIAQSKRNRDFYKRGAGVANLFTGVLKCGYCGGSVTVQRARPRWIGLYCAQSTRGVGCYGFQWRYEEFESAFLRYVSEVNVQGLLRPDDDSGRALESERLAIEGLELGLAKAKDSFASMFRLQSEMLGRGLNSDVAVQTLAAESERIERMEAELSFRRQTLERERLKQEQVRTQQDDLQQAISAFQRLADEDRLPVRTRLSSEIRRNVQSIRMYAFGHMVGGLDDSAYEDSKASIEAIGPVWESSRDDLLALQLMALPVKPPVPFKESGVRYAKLMSYIPRFFRIEYRNGLVETVLVGKDGDGYARKSEPIFARTGIAELDVRNASSDMAASFILRAQEEIKAINQQIAAHEKNGRKRPKLKKTV